MLIAVGSVMASVALNRAEWQDPALWRLQGVAIGIALGYIVGKRKRGQKFSTEFTLRLLNAIENVEDLERKRLVECVFTAQWCMDNLVLPYSIMHSKSKKDKLMVCVAVSDFAHLEVIGEFIEKRLRENDMELECFIELTPNEINEKLDQLAQTQYRHGLDIHEINFGEVRRKLVGRD